MKVYIADIHNKIIDLNEMTNAPSEPWTYVPATSATSTKQNSHLVANIGNYHLSQAYGGYNVHLMVNAAGGVSEPVQLGHSTKKELYDNLCRYMQTINHDKS